MKFILFIKARRGCIDAIVTALNEYSCVTMSGMMGNNSFDVYAHVSKHTEADMEAWQTVFRQQYQTLIINIMFLKSGNKN